MKVCNRCHIDKDDSEFRTRKEKHKNSVYQLLNSTCKKCDAELSREYYNRIKDNPDFIEKNRKRGLEYRNKNYDEIAKRRKTAEYLIKHNSWEKKRYEKYSDFINERSRLRRKTKEYKKSMKEYRKKNKDKIYIQEVVTKKRYHEKNRDLITDKYCLNLIRSNEGFTKGEITKEMIEVKRNQILLWRIRMEILNKKKK